MGYYVIMEEVEEMELSAERTLGEWTAWTEQAMQSLGELLNCLAEKAAGAAAEAAGNYMREVHGCLLGQFGQLAAEMAYRYLQYAAGYYGIEADTRAGEIAQESLEEQAGVLEKGEASFLEEAAQLERLLAGVGDIVSISAPPTAEVETGFREMHREVQGLWEEVGEYEEARLASDFADMEEAMEKLESLIGRVSGKGSVRIGGYRAGELLEYEETARLEELAEERRGYLLEAVPGMEEQMLSCQDRIMARQREELGRQQVIEGTVAGAFVLVSAAVVIGSGFSAAPAAAFLGEAVLGALTFTAVAYQDAKVMEGFHNIALGRAGDITSAAGNPIRDLLPEQLHGAYQAIGEGSTWAVEAWGMGCTLWRAWGQAGVRGAAEELGKMGLAGYGAGKAGEAAEAYGMSGSQVMIIETLSCVGIYGTLSRIRPAAEALGRRRNGLERRGTSAESTEVMRLPGEGAAEYGSFWKPGKLDGIIKEDLLGIGRAYEYQAMARIRREAYAADRIEIREVPELLVSPEELASWERYQDFLRNGSRMEPTREELIGQQRLMEYEALSRVDYEEVLALRRGSEGGSNTIITPEMEEKILLGQRKNPAKNELIGGHSPDINNSNSNYAVEVLQINPDGTRKVKFVTQYADGNLSNIKTSTLFPEGWSNDKIINSNFPHQLVC